MLPTGVNESRHSAKDAEAFARLVESFEKSDLPTLEKLEAFPRFVSKRSLARLLAKYEIYQRIVNVNGVIVECGVLNGAGLFTWAQLANIFEPSNYNRKIIGFDTFAGFPSVSQQDANTDKPSVAGDLKGDALESFSSSIEKYNAERHLSHIPNIELVPGDFMVTGPAYLEANPHLLVSLLYLDFDLYEPTRRALDVFLPRMGKGSIVCFDELNCGNFPGETLAMLEMLPLRELDVRRFPFEPWLSYAVL